jgi:ribosome-associated toxin RatA of RatAB toxin-antitoxin module
MPTARRSIVIDVPPSTLMGVITDFAQYPRFVPDMEEATVLRADGNQWTVKFAVRIIRKVEYTLQLVRVDDLHLRWSLVEGAFKSNNGGWDLVPLDDGRTSATYTLELDLGMFVPGSVLKTLLEHNLPATLEAFKARAEGRA